MANKIFPVLPHSWCVPEWPATIYPHHPSRGRYIVRAFRRELVAAGALTRVGRDLVILGAGYSAWLSKRADKVDGFTIAPNREANEPAAA